MSTPTEQHPEPPRPRVTITIAVEGQPTQAFQGTACIALVAGAEGADDTAVVGGVIGGTQELGTIAASVMAVLRREPALAAVALAQTLAGHGRVMQYTDEVRGIDVRGVDA